MIPKKRWEISAEAPSQVLELVPGPVKSPLSGIIVGPIGPKTPPRFPRKGVMIPTRVWVAVEPSRAQRSRSEEYTQAMGPLVPPTNSAGGLVASVTQPESVRMAM